MPPIRTDLRPGRETTRRTPSARRRARRRLLAAVAGTIIAVVALAVAWSPGAALTVAAGAWLVVGVVWAGIRLYWTLVEWSSHAVIDRSSPPWRVALAVAVATITIGAPAALPLVLSAEGRWRWIALAASVLLAGGHVRSILRIREDTRRSLEEFDLEHASARRR